MIERIRGTEAMLFDIYESDLSQNPTVKSIYKELNKNHETAIRKSDEALLRYIALMYDKNSPIKKEPIDERKRRSVAQAQFETKEESDKATTISDDKVVALINYYLRYQHDLVWGNYMMSLEVFWHNGKMVFSGAGDAKEQKTVMELMKNNDELMNRIHKYEDTIFGDNKDKMAEIIKFDLEDFVEALYDK